LSKSSKYPQIGNEKDNIEERPEEIRKTKQKMNNKRNPIQIEYFNKIKPNASRKLKRTQTKMNKKALKSKQKSNRIKGQEKSGKTK
jgi:hypothetical protein